MTSGDILADTAMRAAAFRHVRKLVEQYGAVPYSVIRQRFMFEGESIALFDGQRGIHKPRQMKYLLSITTSFPKGKRVWYQDQLKVHDVIDSGATIVDYSFQGKNPQLRTNQHLREAWLNNIPVIYFLGVAPGKYTPIFPVYINSWNADSLSVGVDIEPSDTATVGASDAIYDPIHNQPEPTYSNVKQRVGQDIFREKLLSVYKKCTLSGLPEHRLLDAAHITPDSQGGPRNITNGLLLSKLHHAAFDTHLLGIDPDYMVHINQDLLQQQDGPILEALQTLHGESIKLPRNEIWHPDRDRLAERFEEFQGIDS